MSAKDLRENTLGLSGSELVALLRIRPGRALAMIALHAGTWGLAAVGLLHTDKLAFQIPLALASGSAVMGLIQLAHESWHKNLFPRPWQNQLFGELLSLLVGIAYEPMRHDHLAHHKYNRTERDPDAYNVGRRSFGLVMLYYAIVVAGIPLSLIYFNLLYPLQYFDRKKLIRHALVLLAYLVFYTLLFRYLSREGLLHDALLCWLLPILLASPLNGLKSIADHHDNAWRGDRFHTATTARSNRVITFLWNGLNYHLDHHLFPRVPGYNLPRLHARIRPALLARGAPVYESYLEVMWGALRAGPMVVSDEVKLVTLERKAR